MKKHFYIIFIILFSIIAFADVAFYNENYIQNPRIIFLDVGQGDAALIDAGNNIQILIDGGNGKDILNKLGEQMPFYDHQIELIILTHPDKDHMGGLVEVLKYYKVKQVLETGIICETAICQEWNKLISEKNIPVKYAEFGQRIKTENIDMAVLYPLENLRDEKVKDDNNSSIILKIILNNNSFLLTGDAGLKTEDDLMAKNINIEARILKVSHHGSKNATSSEFLKAVNPEKAIISVGKNSYGHPAEELLNRLKSMNVNIFRTDEIGDIILRY